MPRFARLQAPGFLVHAVSNFVNDEFRLASDGDRAYYLSRLDRVIARTDWRLLAYALMSSHVHLALVAGADPFWWLVKPLHTAVGGFLNRTQGRSGPVFQGRPYTDYVPAERAVQLVRYVHNNPVKAGLFDEARDSTWTSHRAYLGGPRESKALAVEAGLQLCGFSPDAAGVAHFNAHVVAHGAESRPRFLTAAAARDRRARVRKAVGAAVELGSPQVVNGKAVQAILAPGETVVRPVWDGGLACVLEAVCARAGVAPDDARFSHGNDARFARRLFVWTAHRELGVSVTQAAAYVALSVAAGSRLLHDGPGRDRCALVAPQIAEELRSKKAATGFAMHCGPAGVPGEKRKDRPR